jgi:hypothetical protein
MNLTQAQAFIGLRASATPTGTNVTNDVQIGVGNTVIPLTGANVAYSLRAFFGGSGDDLVIDLTDGDTTGSTAFVAGTQQVETATAAGTITLAGDATVVVTATGMAGSPLTLNVPVALNDTAAQWAAKVRTALAANVTIAARFDVSGTSTAIILTRKPSSTLSDGVTSVPIRLANDDDLNISLDNGTCTGITTAATSANTTEGFATSGVLILDGDGKDFEGVALPLIGNFFQGILYNCSNGFVVVTGSDDTNFGLYAPQQALFCGEEIAVDDMPYTITADSPAIVTITVIGNT